MEIQILDSVNMYGCYHFMFRKAQGNSYKFKKRMSHPRGDCHKGTLKGE